MVFFDDIVYNIYDIDDGLWVGVFGILELKDILIVGYFIYFIEVEYLSFEISCFMYEIICRLIFELVDDFLSEM